MLFRVRDGVTSPLFSYDVWPLSHGKVAGVCVSNIDVHGS